MTGVGSADRELAAIIRLILLFVAWYLSATSTDILVVAGGYLAPSTERDRVMGKHKRTKPEARQPL